MHCINRRLLALHAVLIFYDNAVKLLRCFPAGSHPLTLWQNIQTVIWISSTAFWSFFIPTLGYSSSLLTSFLTPPTSSPSFDPLPHSSRKQITIENNF